MLKEVEEEVGREGRGDKGREGGKNKIICKEL